MSEDWWYDNGLRARDDLNEIFDGEVKPDYRSADRIARNVVLLAAPLLRVDPNFGENDEAREKFAANLGRFCGLARALYIGEAVDQNAIHGGRFVMTCLEPMGEAAASVLLSARYALAALAITQPSVVFDELWSFPAPEAWCLALRSHDELVSLQDLDTSDSEFWVRPDDDVVSLAAAHRISDAIRAAGGGETMSNN